MNPHERTQGGTRQNETPAKEASAPPEPPRPPPVNPRQSITITKKVSNVGHGQRLHSKSPFFKTLGTKIKSLFNKKAKFKSIFHKRRKLTKKSGIKDEVLGNALFIVSDRSLQQREALLQENLEQSSNIEFSRKKTDRITLYEELRLVERQDRDINASWKGAHLILFFLTFVFGSFCTFCFHVLMYMFDEKCVLSPRMLVVKNEKRNNPTGIIIDYIAPRDYKSIPVEFVTTIWVDKSYCYLPAYVPLFSGICGLIWTTMFMMSSSGTHTLSGLQRPWRVVPAVFIFSTMMSILCMYTSVKTHQGLLDLCNRLAEVFGNDTCSYTINVATISYERRIRGVYQATRLTVAAAWFHTLCWVSAAVLALARMLLIIDFCLVRVRADLIGNIELMLERHEELIRTNEYWNEADTAVAKQKSPESIKVHFVNKGFGTESEAQGVENGSKQDEPTADTQVVDMQKPKSLLKKNALKSTKSSSDITENRENTVNRSVSEKTLILGHYSDDTLKDTTSNHVAKSANSATEHSTTSGIIDQWMPVLKEKLSTLRSYIKSASESLAPLVPNVKEQPNETDTQGGLKVDLTSTPSVPYDPWTPGAPRSWNISTPLQPYDHSPPGPSQTRENTTPLQPYDFSTPGPSQTRDNTTPLQPYDFSTPGPSQTRDNTTPLQPYDFSTSGPSQTRDNTSPLQPYDFSTPGPSQTMLELFHKADSVTSSVDSSQKKEKKKEKQD